jgi:hypothetical protein
MAKDKKAIKIETVDRECYVDLTAPEVQAKGEELALKVQEIDEEVAELKEYTKTEKSRIQGLVNESKKLAECVRQRRELRAVSVDIVDVGEGKVSEVRVDTGEVLRVRPMTDAERQRSLPTIGKGGKTVVPATGAVPARVPEPGVTGSS